MLHKYCIELPRATFVVNLSNDDTSMQRGINIPIMPFFKSSRLGIL